MRARKGYDVPRLRLGRSRPPAHTRPMGADFIDLRAWQEAVGLVRIVTLVSRSVRGPGALGVVEQLLGAAESIPANVAEGYGRGLGKDFARFLRIAVASTAEVESHLRVAVASGRLTAEVADPAIGQARLVRALTTGLARSVARRCRA